MHPIPASFGREPRAILRAEVRLNGRRHAILVMAASWDHEAQVDRMAGDFNANPSNSAVKMLSGTWMISGAAAPPHIFPMAAPKGQIDDILARPGSAWTLREAQLPPEIVASDHRPLLARLRRN